MVAGDDVGRNQACQQATSNLLRLTFDTFMFYAALQVSRNMLFPYILASLLLLCFTPVTISIPVTGATGGVNRETGERPFRQEFSTFASSGPAFDLFILAFQRFQQANQSDVLSYYQVAGKSTWTCQDS